MEEPPPSPAGREEADDEVPIHWSPPPRTRPASPMATTTPPRSPAAEPATQRPSPSPPTTPIPSTPPSPPAADTPPPVSSPPPDPNLELRRSRRTTFGQHSNPFNLPRPTVPPPLPPPPSDPPVAGTAPFQDGGECSRLRPTGFKRQIPIGEQRPLSPVEDSSAPSSPTAPAQVNEPRPGCSINTPAFRCAAFAPQHLARTDVHAAENHNVLWALGRLFEGRQPLLAIVDHTGQLHAPVCCCKSNVTH